MNDYAEFLERKRLAAPACGIASTPPLNGGLKAFQRDIAGWALKRGRAAIFADCGLGKSWMAIEWSRIVAAHTGKPVLILTPLAVAQQFVTEGEKMGIRVDHVGDESEMRGPISVTNYDRLHRFGSVALGGVVPDESSILKDYTSATRNAVIDRFQAVPFKLACTATPSPNDYVELGNHAEFLGAMTRSEMLAMFFTHDGGETQTWRLKGHARQEFWRWVSTWACAIRKPSDLGYSDDGYDLPPLTIVQHVVPAGEEVARAQGALFVQEARTLNDQRGARRGSMSARIALAAEIMGREPDEPWLAWCDLNAESEGLTRAVPGAIEVCGSQPVEVKEARIGDFLAGRARVLVSKPSICGHGLNMQRCARVLFLGISHSFEAWYQAVRRVYRFGQTREVICHVVTSEAESAVVANLQRKQADAAAMAEAMVAEMRETMRAEIKSASRDTTHYKPRRPMTVPAWIGSEEDS